MNQMNMTSHLEAPIYLTYIKFLLLFRKKVKMNYLASIPFKNYYYKDILFEPHRESK